jgi:hypothetical protein
MIENQIVSIYQAADYLGTTSTAIVAALKAKRIRNRPDGQIPVSELVALAQWAEDGGIKSAEGKKPKLRKTKNGGRTQNEADLWQSMQAELKDWTPEAAALPCPHGPGSWEKQVHMAARVKHALPLYHPSDSQTTAPEPGTKTAWRWKYDRHLDGQPKGAAK